MPAPELRDVHLRRRDVIVLLPFLSVFAIFCLHLYIHLCSLCLLCPRGDITLILLYVEQLMWSLCESPEALVHPNPSSAIAIMAGGSDWPYQIHSLCGQLLTVLVIATAPLSLLYRFVCTLYFW